MDYPATALVDKPSPAMQSYVWICRLETLNLLWLPSPLLVHLAGQILMYYAMVQVVQDSDDTHIKTSSPILFS